MSINDVPEIRELYKEFRNDPVDTCYTVSGGNRRKRVTELLVSNYPAR